MGFFPNEGDVDANGAEEVNLRTSAGAELLGQQTSAASLPVVISSDQSEYSVLSAEQKLANTDKLFTMNFEVSGVGTTELPVALFRNPSGSGKTVKLARLTMSNLHQTANTFIRVRAYVAPTVTSDGTGLDERCTHVGAAAPVSVGFSSPTVSANGVRIGQWNVVSSANALVVPLDLWFILDANTQLLMTAQADGTNRIVAASLIWAEV